jgi:hypothetical protein
MKLCQYASSDAHSVLTGRQFALPAIQALHKTLMMEPSVMLSSRSLPRARFAQMAALAVGPTVQYVLQLARHARERPPMTVLSARMDDIYSTAIVSQQTAMAFVKDQNSLLIIISMNATVSDSYTILFAWLLS